MNVEIIRDELHKAPFKPFRLHVSNGAFYDIEHPDLVTLARNAVYIATQIADDGIAEKMVTIGALHVTHLEPIPDLENAETSPSVST